MNRTRRKALNEIIGELYPLLEELRTLAEEEAEALSNIPENLQETERYETMEHNAECLEEASSYIEDAISSIEAAISP